MKIALFHNLPSGGAKRVVFEHARLLSRQHRVDVYTLETANCDFCDESAFAGVFTTPFKPLPLFRSPLGRINQISRSLDILRLRAAMRSVAQRIDRQRYDVVLVYPCQFTVSPAILRFLKTPSVYYRHDVNRRLHDPIVPRPYPDRNRFQQLLDNIDPFPGLYNWLLDREDRRNSTFGDEYLANSCFARESIYRLYGRAPSVCYLGVDTDLFHPLNIGRKHQVISVGEILPKKGYDFVIRSLASIPASLRPPLVIVGNASIPQEKAYLEALARESGVEVQFHLQISDQEVVRLYNESLLTVYAPVLESFGMVPLESMACGTPVVGVAEGGVREQVIHQVNGLLIGRDEGQFGQAVLTLLEDPGLARSMGERGREYVTEQWNWDRAGSLLVHYLEMAIARSLT